MTNRMVVLTGYRMESLKRHDRKKYDRLNEMVSDGLRDSPEPDIEWNSTVGRLEPKPDPEPDRCAWVCPSTCRNCLVENCADRLAGGVNE